MLHLVVTRNGGHLPVQTGNGNLKCRICQVYVEDQHVLACHRTQNVRIVAPPGKQEKECSVIELVK